MLLLGVVKYASEAPLSIGRFGAEDCTARSVNQKTFHQCLCKVTTLRSPLLVHKDARDTTLERAATLVNSWIDAL